MRKKPASRLERGGIKSALTSSGGRCPWMNAGGIIHVGGRLTAQPPSLAHQPHELQWLVDVGAGVSGDDG